MKRAESEVVLSDEKIKKKANYTLKKSINVLSDEGLEKSLGIELPKKKKTTTDIETQDWETSYQFPLIKNGNEHTVKRAMMSATSEGYLRGVVTIGITKDRIIKARLYEPYENPFTDNEVAAAILLANEEVQLFKEEGSTHQIAPHSMYKKIEAWYADIDNLIGKTIINIHHDYVKVFRDAAVDLTPLIWKILEKDTKPERM